MENIVAFILLAAVIGVSLYTAVRRRKGGCCCSGSCRRPKKKKLKNAITHRIFKVSGMHCAHCKNRIEDALNGIPGVCAVAKPAGGEVVVSYEMLVEDACIISRIEELGYTVLSAD